MKHNFLFLFCVMEIISLLKLGENILELMSKNDIKVTDYKYISLYDKYLKLREERCKYWYAIKVLSEEYEISESAVCRLIRKFSKNVDF